MSDRPVRRAHNCRDNLDYIGGAMPFECTVCARQFDAGDNGGSYDIRDMFTTDAADIPGDRRRSS